MKINKYYFSNDCYVLEIENKDDIELISKSLFKRFGFYSAEDFKIHLSNHYGRVIVQKNNSSQIFKKISKMERVKKLKKIL